MRGRECELPKTVNVCDMLTLFISGCVDKLSEDCKIICLRVSIRIMRPNED